MTKQNDELTRLLKIIIDDPADWETRQKLAHGLRTADWQQISDDRELRNLLAFSVEIIS